MKTFPSAVVLFAGDDKATWPDKPTRIRDRQEHIRFVVNMLTYGRLLTVRLCHLSQWQKILLRSRNYILRNELNTFLFLDYDDVLLF